MLEGRRVILRRPEASDLAWQQLWLNTPAIKRHLGGVSAPDAVRAGFERGLAAFALGEPGFWTVGLRHTGQPIGKCGLASISGPTVPAELDGELQVGWTLAEHCWGHGYASEAARLAIAHAFDELRLEVLWAQTSDSNIASTRVMGRLGFERRHDLAYDDPDYPPTENPTAVYQLSRSAWAAQH